MSRKTKSKPKRNKLKSKTNGNNVESKYDESKKKPLKIKDKFILKLKDYFLFSECMFYNKEYLSWYSQNLMESEVKFMKMALRFKRPNLINWKSFNYHKLIGQGSFGKGFIASFNFNNTIINTNDNKSINVCLIKMIGARKGDDIQNHYTQLINERDSLIKLGGIWTPRLYACFIERKLASIFVQEFIDGETIAYIKKLIKIDNGRELYPLLENELYCENSELNIPVLTQRQYEIIKFYMAELMSAIKFIHDRGVLHRDLKENNILLTCNGHLKLIDFGLAKRHCCHENRSRSTKTDLSNTWNNLSKDALNNCSTSHLLQPYVSNPHRLWGNRYYAAPEYVREEKRHYDDKGDYWAVGIIFFHLLFGCRPYKQIVHNKISELSHSIMNWKVDSFLCQKILQQRCVNHPDILEAFFNLICDEEFRLCDKSTSFNNSNCWLPESWKFFENLNLNQMINQQPPIKIPSNKKMYSLNSHIELSTIIKTFCKDKFIEHLDCPYFNYISPIDNDLLKNLV